MYNLLSKSVPFAIMLLGFILRMYVSMYMYVATLYCRYKKSFLFCLFLFLYLNDSFPIIKFVKTHVQGLKLTLVPHTHGMQVLFTGTAENS